MQDSVAFQVILLVAGALLGLILSLFVQPLLQDRSEVILVKVLGKLIARRRGSLEGEWRFVWAKDGVSLGRQEEVTVKVAVAGQRMSATFTWRDRDYWFLAQRTTQEYISGTYFDREVGLNYHGAFQLKVLTNERTMKGKWMGFS